MKLKASDGWTRRDEVRQRIGNCKRLLVFAWLALWYDSTLFAGVFLNCARAQGDLVISRIVMPDGREFDIDLHPTPESK